jgi:WD40 repeat protein
MALYALAVSANGKYLASGDRAGEVRIWEFATGKLAQRFIVGTLYTYDARQRKRSIGGVRALAFSADSTLLAIGGIGQVENVDGFAGPAHVEVWNWSSGERCSSASAQGHKGIVNHLAFHPHGPWLVGAGGGDDAGFLAFWKSDGQTSDSNSGQRIKADGHIHCFHINANGAELYAAGYRTLEIWSLA